MMVLQEEPDTESESALESAVLEPSTVGTGTTSVPVNSHILSPYPPSEPSVFESSSGTRARTEHPRSSSVPSMSPTPYPSSTVSSSTTVWTSPLTISSDTSSDILRTLILKRASSQPSWLTSSDYASSKRRTFRTQSSTPTILSVESGHPETSQGAPGFASNLDLNTSSSKSSEFASSAIHPDHHLSSLPSNAGYDADDSFYAPTDDSLSTTGLLAYPRSDDASNASTTTYGLSSLLSASRPFAEPTPSHSCEFCSFPDPLFDNQEGQGESGRVRFVDLPPEARRWFLLLERGIDRCTIEKDEVRCGRCGQKVVLERDFPYLPRMWLVHERVHCPARDELGSCSRASVEAVEEGFAPRPAVVTTHYTL